MVETFKNKFNKRFGFPPNTSHSVSEVARLTGYKKSGLDTIIAKGKGAYYSNPQSVRPHIKGPEEWGFSRLYASVSPGSKASKVDAKQLIKK
jgi:hypothetical protein